MKSLQENMVEFRKQLEKGAIQKAYLGLMEYMMSLKNYFSNKYPDYSTPGGIYNGYMDMTYFSIFPKSLKDRDLKIAIVFLYDTFRFEIWLSGKNKQVLAKYWQIISKSKWNKYKIVEPTKGVDSVVEHILVDNPDFSDLDVLTKQIEQGTLKFIQDIERFLAKKASQQSVHPTLGSLARFQAFFHASAFSQSDGVPPPAPARVTQTVRRLVNIGSKK